MKIARSPKTVNHLRNSSKEELKPTLPEGKTQENMVWE